MPDGQKRLAVSMKIAAPMSAIVACSDVNINRAQ
jgi:hypothetical protein